MAIMSKDDREAIIIKGDMTMLVRKAEEVGEILVKNHRLTTSQIRNIFGTVRRIEMDWLSPDQINDTAKQQAGEPEQNKLQERQIRARREFILLLPRLAYQAQKERGRGVQALSEELDPAMRMVIDAQEPQDAYNRFRNFVDFFEAILAYHRAFGGSNN